MRGRWLNGWLVEEWGCLRQGGLSITNIKVYDMKSDDFLNSDRDNK